LSEKINYIKHLQFIHKRIVADDRLSPWHISLYYTLFHTWNFNQFSTDFQIVRSVIMNEAKIGSVNTYTKCLKELHTWGYVIYSPSFNPYKSSMISIITFDKGSDKGADTGSDNSTDKTPDNTPDNSGVMAVRPLIKHIKTNINYNKTNINTNSNELVYTQNENEENFNFKNKKNVSKKVETNTPKNLEEVETYFLEKEKPKSEAHKFFNYYEANGWLVGKNKMKNWRAAANNWISNIGKYSSQPQEEKTTYLHVNQDKDYSIPL
jgi:hypothetical protein